MGRLGLWELEALTVNLVWSIEVSGEVKERNGTESNLGSVLPWCS